MAADVAVWAAHYSNITIDLGAGDGRFARNLAIRSPERGVIALDLCEANMQAVSRKAPGNALFVVGDALALPAELRGLASCITINFPWGSLLRGLVDGDPAWLAGLKALANGQTELDILLNGGALAELGLPIDAGAEMVVASLRPVGAKVGAPRTLGAAELRRYPTTWAKRLAFGRDPRAVRIAARLSGVAAEIVSTPARRPDRAPASLEPDRRSPARAGAFPGAG
jgi:16S rRNA (adenine(1408)-N(1))-methyltransferase